MGESPEGEWHSPLVRLFADVIRSGASAIDGEIDVALFGDVPEDGFSHRRATDVTKAHNENFGCHDESCHKLLVGKDGSLSPSRWSRLDML